MLTKICQLIPGIYAFVCEALHLTMQPIVPQNEMLELLLDKKRYPLRPLMLV